MLAEDKAKVYLQAPAQAVWAPKGQTPQVKLDPRKDAACFSFLQRQWRIEVVLFPVGAPDLNPQEQVWKLVRRAVEHNHDHNRIGALADAFKAELRSRSFTSSFFGKYGGAVVCPFLD